MTLAVHRTDNNGLALHQPTDMPATRPDAVARLAQWAESAQAAHTIAGNLVQTSFVPEAFRNKPLEATAAILAGAEVGLSPMAALRSFDIIQGTAAPRAITLRAVVQSHGHEVRVVESTETRAVVEGRRRGEPAWQRSVWTVDRAKKMGLTNKKNWQVQPGAMLVARATSEVCRWIASDAIAGIAYSSEELGDVGYAPEPVVSSEPSEPVKATRTARRKPVEPVPPRQVEEPDFDEPAASANAPVSGPPNGSDDGFEPMTKPQQGMMHALFNQVGITERPDRMTYVNEVLAEHYGADRQVGSSSELSKDETGKVIDSLQKWADQLDPAEDGGAS